MCNFDKKQKQNKNYCSEIVNSSRVGYLLTANRQLKGEVERQLLDAVVFAVVDEQVDTGQQWLAQTI
jgi:hypothetical protein